MDQTLIYFLIVCIVWAALLYYVFIIRQADDLGAGGKSALAIVSILIIPFLGMVLWSQNQSFQRLEQLGFTVFGGLESSVGVTVGGGSDPTWLYSLSTAESEVLEFYQRPKNHHGWKLVSITENALVFKKDGWKMRLQVSNGKAAFLLFNVGEAKPNKSVESDN